MDEIPARELRNEVSAVLRRVEAGERLRITLNGRPVAELVPLPRRPTSLSWNDFQRALEGSRADAGLGAQLTQLFPDTTDDVVVE